MLLYERRRPDARPGTLFALDVGGYGLGRLRVEALRIDDATRIAGVRVNIWVSLIAIASSLVALTVLRHRQRTESRADPAHEPEPHPTAP